MTVHRGIPRNRRLGLEKAIETVRPIVESVKKYGDKALIEYTKAFDGIELKRISIAKESLKECYEGLSLEVMKAVDKLYELLLEVHKQALPREIKVEVQGIEMGYVWRSIEKVGVYVPGGKKSYPSSLLMAGVPARVAGVRELYVASPPATDKCVNPAVAYAAEVIGVEEVYNIGGAQAIAALAFGTESVKKVDKVVGPGNIYVQAAKILVQDVVSIDSVEGPTELIVLADESADPRFVALDMMAQAEHGYGTLVALITTSEKLANDVIKILEEDKEHEYYVEVVEDLDKGVDMVNELAPEHLSLHVLNAEKYLNKVVNAGAVSLSVVPPAVIDYVGPNHVLPTNGWARTRGALSVYDFLKPISVVFSVKNMDPNVVRAVEVLARYEGFEVHGKSVGVRFERRF